MAGQEGLRAWSPSTWDDAHLVEGGDVGKAALHGLRVNLPRGHEGLQPEPLKDGGEEDEELHASQGLSEADPLSCEEGGGGREGKRRTISHREPPDTLFPSKPGLARKGDCRPAPSGRSRVDSGGESSLHSRILCQDRSSPSCWEPTSTERRLPEENGTKASFFLKRPLSSRKFSG